MLSKSAYVCPHSFKQTKDAAISFTCGNLYGIADYTTPIYTDYARGALNQWELCLRATLKRLLLLPRSFPTDLLHLITGIPSVSVLLRKKVIGRLKMLLQALQDSQDPDEKKMLRYNLEKMSAKQITKLGISQDDLNIHRLTGLQYEAESSFWSLLLSRNNFPEELHTQLIHGELDSIYSRSLTAKEIYHHMHPNPNPHTPQSLL
jgi:hypothetical protein